MQLMAAGKVAVLCNRVPYHYEPEDLISDGGSLQAPPEPVSTMEAG